jgi:peptidoglycan hydrolase-like protein with peptidoglycan-binding domain
MTIAMPDSIFPVNLPGGYRAYLGYSDGFWHTAPELRSKFPGAEIVSLTVQGGSAVADGCDIENGDLTPASGAAWLAQRIAAGQKLPVAYCSAANVKTVLQELADRHVARDQVRLLSAHYSWKPGAEAEHVCGPDTCKETPVACDGTQWTDAFAGVNGARIDMSVLEDGFFGAPAPAAPLATSYTWTEFDMSKLPVLKQNDADKPGGGFFYVHRAQELVKLSGGLLGVKAAEGIAVDGNYGPATKAAVEAIQAHYKIGADGVCGAQTWSVLLTGSA